MKNSPIRFFAFALFAFASIAPAYSTQIFWSKGTSEKAATLSVYLGDGYQKRKIATPAGAFTLVVQKSMIEDDTLRFVWKSNQDVWLAKTKKIPEESTTETVTLPAGKPMDLEIRTAAGLLLATIEFREP